LQQTEHKIKPELKIINALIKNKELEQYKMPKETKLSYRTILRTLKPMENEGYVNEPRTERSKKGGKEKKIYTLKFKGALTYLSSIKPQPEDYLIKDRICYTLEKNNKIIMEKFKPLTIDTITSSLENLGNKIDFPIFKQINWLKEHYGLDIFRVLVWAASSTINKDKLPNLSNVKKSLIIRGEKTQNIELTLKDFRWLEEDFLRETFTEEFAFQLPFLKAKGDLQNETLEQLFTKLISKIEKKNQIQISPLKEFVQTLK
jgi:DNA-binding PadR family transcriptional regulator